MSRRPILRLHDSPNDVYETTQLELADMFEVPINPLILQLTRAKIFEMEAAGMDLECLTKRKPATHLTLAEKLEIIRLHDETNPGDCKTQEELADMFQVPIHPLIVQLTR